MNQEKIRINKAEELDVPKTAYVVTAQIEDLQIWKGLNDGYVVDFIVPDVELLDAFQVRRPRSRQHQLDR